MRKQYLQLTAYRCRRCAGPFVTGSLEVREDGAADQAMWVGAICLSCGHRQSGATEQTYARQFSPVEWEPVAVIESQLATAFAEAADRSEQRRPSPEQVLMLS